MSIVLVGEMNPYGADPRCALFCEPPNSAGGRMQRLVCGLHRRTYLGIARVNLCAGKWSMLKARETAAGVLKQHSVVVLLGRKVADAFRVAHVEPFTTQLHKHLLSPRIVALPHPSGLCRVWNEPGAFARTRAVLREAVPEVPWGELDGEVAPSRFE